MEISTNKKLRDVTLVFLIKETDGQISQICLAMKKRGFGKDRWNGVGGKVNKGESIEEATIREAEEEIGVKIKKLKKIAELSFYFPHKPEWDQIVHTYFCEEWEGNPLESEEMKPDWFNKDNLPFDLMWPDDIFWLPKVLSGSLIKATFVFGEGDVIKNQKIDVVENL